MSDAAALDALLARERALLRAGAFDALQGIEADKAALLARLVADPPEAEDLQRLAQGLQRNRRLLGAALEGVRAAAARLADHRGAAAAFDTYDREGRRAPLAPGRPGHVSRA